MTSRTHDNFRHNFWTWVDPPPVWTLFKKTALFWNGGIPKCCIAGAITCPSWSSTYYHKLSLQMVKQRLCDRSVKGVCPCAQPRCHCQLSSSTIAHIYLCSSSTLTLFLNPQRYQPITSNWTAMIFASLASLHFVVTVEGLLEWRTADLYLPPPPPQQVRPTQPTCLYVWYASCSMKVQDPASTMQKTGWTIHSFFLIWKRVSLWMW